MDRIALDLGFLHIYWYSIFIFLGILSASFIILREMKKRGIPEDFTVNLFFNAIIFGIIGARLYYVAFNIGDYISNPIEIFQTWNGGLAIHGGLLAGFISIYLSCKKNKINLLKILDIIVVGLILGQAIGRWGNFFNSEAYGAITTLEHLQKAGIPEFICKGMYILGDYRQPTFFYESTWNLIGFFALLIIRRYPYLKKGQLTGFYLIWYSIARFLIEGMRTDSLMLGPIRMAQLVSVILLIVGIYFFFIHNRKASRFENLYKSD